MPSRRALLRILGVGAAPLAGCLGRRAGETATDPADQAASTTARRSTSGTSSGTVTSATTDVYVSEILPNPEGDDGERVNEEYVLVEMNADRTRDLSSFALEYGETHRYAFPDLVSSVASGSSLVIRSGTGENRVEGSEYPDYLLFAGSDEPLLANDGMQLTVRDGDGAIVDRVTYGDLDEGQFWVQPE